MSANKALTLIDIVRDALTVQSMEGLGFVIANRPHALLAFDQALFWIGDTKSPTLHTVSGHTTLDPDSPFAQSLKEQIKDAVQKSENKPIIMADNGKSLLIRLETDQEGVLGGLWITREKPFREAELTVTEELRLAFSAALALQTRRERFGIPAAWQRIKTHKKIIWGVLLILALFPVRLTISAPAEIVSADPAVVTAPYEGLVETVTVDPGQVVKKGDELAQMDLDALLARRDRSQQDVRIAHARLSRLRREAIADPQKKAELEQLRAEIALKQIDYEYAEEMLARSSLSAPRDGTAIFSDKNALIGKPVAAGTMLMQIADPGQAELLVRIPVDAMLPIDEGASVRLFLNVEPLKSHRAEIRTIGYQASTDPDGLLTYKLRADLPDSVQPRIGWQGTARIKGDWSIFSYAVLRKPLIALRRITGL